MKVPFKIRVTPETSAKVQAFVFANGGRWPFDSGSPKYITAPFLFVSQYEELSWGGFSEDALSHFNSHEYPEVTVDELLNPAPEAPWYKIVVHTPLGVFESCADDYSEDGKFEVAYENDFCRRLR